VWRSRNTDERLRVDEDGSATYAVRGLPAHRFRIGRAQLGALRTAVREARLDDLPTVPETGCADCYAPQRAKMCDAAPGAGC